MFRINRVSMHLVLVLVLALVVVGCAPQTPAPTPPATGTHPVVDDKYGGTVVFRILGEPTSLVPHGAGDTIAGLTGMMLNEPLVRLNIENEWEGRLVKDWTISNDGLVYTFNLRENAKWHDGKPVTADDVVFTHELIMNPDAKVTFRAQQFVGGQAIKYEKVTDQQFRVILPQVFAPVLSYLITPVPKHIWQGVPASDYLTSTLGQKPVSSGPFKFVEYRASDRIVFAAFEDHFDGRPYLDQVIYSIIPDNNSAAVALETGQIDFTDVPGDVFVRWEGSDKVKTFRAPSGNVQFLSLNNSVFPFNDATVRKALGHLTNKRAIADQVMLGYAQPAHNFMVPSDIYYNEDVLTKYDYDLNKAKNLLGSAGFTAGSDGILAKDGKKLEFEILIHSGNVQREQAGLVLQSEFAKAGVKVNLRSLEWSALVAVLNDKARPRPYQALIIGNTLGPDPTRYRLVYHSAADSYMEYYSDEADALFDAGDKETDFEKRRAIYEELQTVITNDAPVVWLWYAETLYGMSNRLRIDEAEITGLGHLRLLKPGKLWVAK